MPKYDVHLFSVVRFAVRNIEAESMEEACKKAEQVLSEETIKSALCGDSAYEAEFDDEVIEALVDVQGDEDYSESTWFKPAGETWAKKEGSNQSRVAAGDDLCNASIQSSTRATS